VAADQQSPDVPEEVCGSRLHAPYCSGWCTQTGDPPKTERCTPAKKEPRER
jgi:hypothetical protein